jgi:tetratricopeptide repeat protein 8
MSKFRRRKYAEATDICTALLEQNQRDQAAWFLKCRSMTCEAWVDDIEIDVEGVADQFMDENAMASMPRPGTSLARPLSSAGGPTPAVRPISASGRPQTGFSRPVTSRPTTGSTQGRDALQTAMAGRDRPGTGARPVTSSGRLVRLGTASMQQEANGQFIIVESLNLAKYAQRTAIAKALCDYIIYYLNNPRKALELASEGTKLADYKDWWWKARLGKCYFQMGMYRDAEKQFKSAIKEEDSVGVQLELAKCLTRLDQPNAALDVFSAASEKFSGDTSILLGIARIYDQLNANDKAMSFYKRVLVYDSMNAEALACLASSDFYSDKPEVALRFYRRLLQNGVMNAEIWNNLGLCCFYAGQYDMTLSCFERSLMLADDSNMADVWYNIGQVAIGVGDLGLAYQAFRIAISVEASHAESYNNLGVLELRKGNVDQAQAHFRTAMDLGSHLFEPAFNAGLLAFKLGEFQDSAELAQKALEAYPEHFESKELLKQLKAHYQTL